MFLPYGTARNGVGDYMLAGKHHGKIKAMHDEENIVTVAGPSTPVSVLGLDGAAAAGDKFNILKTKKKRNKLLKTFSINA
jgi:translation initiation factor IF-2